MRILITGSRDWVDLAVIFDALVQGLIDVLCTVDIAGHTGAVTVVHGAARGADSIAADLARRIGCRVEPHPVTDEDWRRLGRSAGHRRNAEMVALGADLVLAFPLGESRGTRGCIELARRAGLDVRVFEGQVIAS